MHQRMSREVGTLCHMIIVAFVWAFWPAFTCINTTYNGTGVKMWPGLSENVSESCGSAVAHCYEKTS